MAELLDGLVDQFVAYECKLVAHKRALAELAPGDAVLVQVSGRACHGFTVVSVRGDLVTAYEYVRIDKHATRGAAGDLRLYAFEKRHIEFGSVKPVAEQLERLEAMKRFEMETE